MGLKAWWQTWDPLGRKAFLEEIRLERATQRELLAQMVQTTREQSQTAAQLMGTLRAMYEALTTDGTPPEGRHLSEEAEADLFEHMDQHRG